MTTQAPRIFLSYSRSDGALFAQQIRDELTKTTDHGLGLYSRVDHPFSLWRDIEQLETGSDWWTQIEEALRSESVEHLVLVLTPDALTSPVIKREVRLARQEGVRISPIMAPGYALKGIPRRFGEVIGLSIPERRTRQIRTLEGPSNQPRVPMMADEPPEYFVNRPTEFEAIKSSLLNTKGDVQTRNKNGAAVAIAAALKGAGGYGKTMLAQAIAHDDDIQDAFVDGVLWVTLGENLDKNLTALITDLIKTLNDDCPTFQTVEAAGNRLAETLGERRYLLVIDDVWNIQDLRPFLRGGRLTTRLITTRDGSLVPESAVKHDVDEMVEAQADQLLSLGLNIATPEAQSSLDSLTGSLKGWAQLISLVNGWIREDVAFGAPLLDSIRDAAARYATGGPFAFEPDNAEERTRTIDHTIRLSIERGLRDEASRARFLQLAVFPDEIDVPVSVATELWNASGSDAKDLLKKLARLSLLQRYSSNGGAFGIHDNVRHFLLWETKATMQAEHGRLADLLIAAFRSRNSAVTRTDVLAYAYHYLLRHLQDAGRHDEIDQLLLNFEWMEAKLQAAGIQSLVADYPYTGGLGALDAHKSIGRILATRSKFLTDHPRQLKAQILGRLGSGHNRATARIIQATLDGLDRDLVPFRSTFLPPGTETARLEGHAGEVTALSVLPDGRLASGSDDGTIRLWDAATGAETTRLEGHGGWVRALAVLPDGRLASNSFGEFIRLWDVATGAETTWRGRGGGLDWVGALAVLPDGRLASGGFLGSIILCEVATGAETTRLEGHWRVVNALAVLPDGRLASGSDDGTIRLWDAATGAETARLKWYGERVTALAVLPDGRLASGSSDKTIRLWDVSTGAETARLDRHGREVTALAALPDGRLASGFWDGTIRLWDVSTGTETARLEGHGDWVRALAVLTDSRLASGSNEGAIRLCDVTTGNETARLEGHGYGVNALVVLPDGRLASGCDDGTIRLWDAATGAETARLDLDSAVTCLAMIASESLVVAGDQSGRIHWLKVR